MKKSKSGEELAALAWNWCHLIMGWAEEQERELKANQFLLREAITHLKQAGFRWFDLGRIAEKNTPGINVFELAVRGESWNW